MKKPKHRNNEPHILRLPRVAVSADRALALVQTLPKNLQDRWVEINAIHTVRANYYFVEALWHELYKKGAKVYLHGTNPELKEHLETYQRNRVS